MKSNKVHTDFLSRVEKEIGRPPLDALERVYLEDRYCEEYAKGPGSAEFEEAVSKAANDIESFRRVWTKRLSVPYSGKGAPRKDDRWELIVELHKAAFPEAPLPAIFSTSGSIRRVSPQRGNPPDLKQDVQITFDDRLSLQEVVRLLKRFWPHLRKDGIIRTTHPLEKRKIETLRLVCLEMPDASWEKRLRRWNVKHPEDRYSETRALITACHDAGKSLTGYRDGLVWFYDRMARIPRKELRSLAAASDAAAKREWARRKREWFRMLSKLDEAGLIEVIRIPVPKSRQQAKRRQP